MQYDGGFSSITFRTDRNKCRFLKCIFFPALKKPKNMFHFFFFSGSAHPSSPIPLLPITIIRCLINTYSSCHSHLYTSLHNCPSIASNSSSDLINCRLCSLRRHFLGRRKSHPRFDCVPPQFTAFVELLVIWERCVLANDAPNTQSEAGAYQTKRTM